jgi:hypothetical protein
MWWNFHSWRSYLVSGKSVFGIHPYAYSSMNGNFQSHSKQYKYASRYGQQKSLLSKYKYFTYNA